MRNRLFLGLVLALLTASCVATTPTGRTRNPDMLTREEITASDQMTAYDLIRTLRPSWLRTRGVSSVYNENPIVVYLDGQAMGTIDALNDIPRLSIERMRFYSPMHAQARFGLNHTNGAIEVITRRI